MAQISALKKLVLFFRIIFQGMTDIESWGRNGTILTRMNYPGPVSIFSWTKLEVFLTLKFLSNPKLPTFLQARQGTFIENQMPLEFPVKDGEVAC
jgi:hypothetical protein